LESLNKDVSLKAKNGGLELITPENIVQIIGKPIFRWLVDQFDQNTTLKDLPEEILNRIVSLHLPIADYETDTNALTCIALITFAYKLAGRVQEPRNAEKDMLLAKVLAKNELARRTGKRVLANPQWSYPVYELIAGEIGDKIRQSPLDGR